MFDFDSKVKMRKMQPRSTTAHQTTEITRACSNFIKTLMIYFNFRRFFCGFDIV